jgi:hypothetical protein
MEVDHKGRGLGLPAGDSSDMALDPQVAGSKSDASSQPAQNLQDGLEVGMRWRL